MTDDIIKGNPIPKNVLRLMEEAAEYVGRSEAETADAEMWNTLRDVPITSPIEQLFFCGLYAVARTNGFRLSTVIGSPFPMPPPDLRVIDNTVLCYPQSPIGNYRADFVLYLVDGPNPMPTVVELDGHEWHDRNEKQRRYEKRRDRYMQARGFRVARYTGSEIVKDPYKAAANALSLVVASDDYFVTPEEYWGG